jgi:hypothetical protein
MKESPKSDGAPNPSEIEKLKSALNEAHQIIKLVEQQRERAHAEARTLEIHLAIVREELAKEKADKAAEKKEPAK